jgi:hypothetical protein
MNSDYVKACALDLSRRRRRIVGISAVIFCFVILSSYILLLYPVHAEGLYQRQFQDNIHDDTVIRNLDGDHVKVLLEPTIREVSIINLILFGTMVIMALELLNFVSGHLGRK